MNQRCVWIMLALFCAKTSLACVGGIPKYELPFVDSLFLALLDARSQNTTLNPDSYTYSYRGRENQISINGADYISLDFTPSEAPVVDVTNGRTYTVEKSLLTVRDLETSKILRRQAFLWYLNPVVVSPDGKFLYISSGVSGSTGSSGRLTVLNAGDYGFVQEYRLSGYPFVPLINGTGKELFVLQKEGVLAVLNTDDWFLREAALPLPDLEQPRINSAGDRVLIPFGRVTGQKRNRAVLVVDAGILSVPSQSRWTYTPAAH